ncbi:YesL family protein [Aquisalibacillus elongatus]|uniref:Putative membrane protein YesL n=1 Tax=Aquisalibacillus elongatus TaxID=485577 RepID=A0A3N5C486_9BACI|nr:DUF624 domain-containing protein [Aquisalibacillus elongatus]RPF54272.1 putative membrane protein YesL [Aquisalibacillus elongatus]
MTAWNRFNEAAYWLLRAIYLNFLWMIFTLLGAVFFGIFPATVAMFHISRQWLVEKDLSLRVFKKFWRIYKAEFIKTNVFAIAFIICAYILYIDFIFLILADGWVNYLYPVFILLAFMYVATLTFFFPVYVNFQLKRTQYIKQSFLIAMASPLHFVMIIMSLTALGIVAFLLPGIVPLFTGSVMAFVTTYLTNHSIERIKIKQQKNFAKEEPFYKF